MTDDIIKNKKQFEKDTKIFDSVNKIKVKCKFCGHTETIPVFLDEKLCSQCKRMIINTTTSHFKYKMRKELEKNN